MKRTSQQTQCGFFNVWVGAQQPDISRFIVNKPAPPKIQLFDAPTVSECLKQLKTSKPGPDGLSAILLKSRRHEICDILATLFNLCISHSFVPSQWKRANIFSIPKVDHPTE
jgi:hypothetical protein